LDEFSDATKPRLQICRKRLDLRQGCLEDLNDPPHNATLDAKVKDFKTSGRKSIELE
jgi:hypothetical protein